MDFLYKAFMVVGAVVAFMSCQSVPAGSVLEEHYGGNIKLVMEDIMTLEGPIRVEGLCASACTVVLGRDDYCLAPGSLMLFHGPSSSIPGKALSPRVFNVASVRLASWYPTPLQDWFLEVGRFGEYVFTAKQMSARFGAELC